MKSLALSVSTLQSKMNLSAKFIKAAFTLDSRGATGKILGVLRSEKGDVVVDFAKYTDSSVES